MSEPVETAPADEVRKAIYDQDCAFNRHRHIVQWTRFNTVAIVEGGALLAAYQVRGLQDFERIGVLLFATLLIALIFLLVVADEKDIAAHLRRIRAYEAATPFEARHPFWGKWAIRAAIALIGLFNLTVIGRFACCPLPISPGA